MERSLGTLLGLLLAQIFCEFGLHKRELRIWEEGYGELNKALTLSYPLMDVSWGILQVLKLHL